MKAITIYFNYASKTNAGYVEIDEHLHIEDVIKEWIALGYCKVHLHANHQWVYVNWQNVVYVAYDHANVHQVTDRPAAAPPAVSAPAPAPAAPAAPTAAIPVLPKPAKPPHAS